MKISTNGKRNITLDFNAPKNFRIVQNGVEIPYLRTGKNSFRLSKKVDGDIEMEEVKEKAKRIKPFSLQSPQMTFISSDDVDRLNSAIEQISLVNPQDVAAINNAAEKIDSSQMYIAEKQQQLEATQVYIDQQQQRLNETALGIQALETDNSQRLDGAENAILNLAGDIANTQNMAVDSMNTALNKIEEQGILLQAEIDKKADKDELETLRKDFEEKSDQFSNAMSNYSGGYAYDTLPRDGEAGQILAKRTDRQGDYIWIDQTPVIVKSETIPTASEKYKGEVYQYVGETGDYTHGYIYECQEIENNFVWVRLDVQPNTAVWGQITGTLSDQTDLQNALDDKQDKLSQTQMDAVNSGANQSNIAQITTNQTNINTINSKIPSAASSSNQLTDKDYVDTADNDLQTAINGKQDTLVSGTNIKTINGSSVLGSGDLSVTAQIAWGSISGTLSNQTDLQNALNAKANDSAVVKLTGNQTISGTKAFSSAVQFANNTLNNIGDDVKVGDGNVGGCLVIQGTNNATGIQLRPQDGTTGNNRKIYLNNDYISLDVTPATSDNSTKIATTAYVVNVLKAIYPVGAVYIGTTSTCPLASFFGTWTLKSSGIVTSVNTSVPIAGNGMTMGLTNGTTNYGMSTDGSSTAILTGVDTLYGTNVGTTRKSGGPAKNKTMGLTTDATKSGIVGTASSSKYTVNIWERTA